MISLNEFNDASAAQAKILLSQCCTCEAWINQLVQGRPYFSVQEVRQSADSIWQELSENDYLQAFDGHPKIGDVNSLKEKYKSTKELASNEQSGMAVARNDVIVNLAEKNDQYLKKYGFIFIVCATGKTASEMLDLLMARLENDRSTELIIAAEEQRKIYHLRLNKLLEEDA